MTMQFCEEKPSHQYSSTSQHLKLIWLENTKEVNKKDGNFIYDFLCLRREQERRQRISCLLLVLK